jgi:hypothetical protein
MLMSVSVEDGKKEGNCAILSCDVEGVSVIKVQVLLLTGVDW